MSMRFTDWVIEEQEKKMEEQEMSKMSEPKSNIVIAKELRVELDRTLQKLKLYRDSLGPSAASRHASLSVTHTEDAIMRLGMVLKELGTANPYPDSYKPGNTIVNPTADGLKL